MLKTLGWLFLLSGIAACVVVIIASKNIVYGLQVYLDSGKIIEFQSKDKKFLDEFQKEIVMGIKDGAVRTYIDMRDSHIEENVMKIDIEKLYEQNGEGNTIFNGEINVGKGNMGNIVFGNNEVQGDVHAEQNENRSVETNPLSEEQWEALLNFFEKRASEMEAENTKCFDACMSMQRYANNKDASGLKKYITHLEKETFLAILGSGAAEAVKQALTLILKMP